MEADVDDNSRYVKWFTMIDMPHKARRINIITMTKITSLINGSLKMMPHADSAYKAQAKKHNEIITVIIYGKLLPKVSANLFIKSAIP